MVTNETQPRRIVRSGPAAAVRAWHRTVAVVESVPAQMCGFAVLGGVVSYIMFSH